MKTIKLKSAAVVGVAILLFACGGESESTETSESLEELGNVLEELNDDLNEIEGVSEIYTITNDAAGDFKLGELIPESSDKYTVTEKTITIQSEEGPYEDSVHGVSIGEEEILILTGEYDFITDTFSDEIGEINIYSDQFQTVEGIGVGSTITEFMNAYPEYSIWYTYVSEMYVIQTAGLDIQFLMDGNGFNGEPDTSADMVSLKADQFDPETKITSIRMFKPWS